MTAILKNITIDQGADYQRPFLILDENGNPVDLTGAYAAMQVSTAYGFPAVLTLTTSNGGLVIGGENGTITPVVSAAMTSPLVPGNYLYDVKLVFANGKTVRPFQGTATVSPEVTVIVPTPPSSGGQFNFSIAGNSGLAAGVF
ncbi:hypothetical protein [Fimbriiglobus ruber]|uniref:Uncharacterized protein n=1 Tax=Fimbriiglobus ruber TaxID=1908690 RepID=A0A225DMH1_9BACT|nr:hypothetical protein [Fimbriiglobus ruber]OWK42213.1 hypothetical protein FRUB_04291 [Fimbriiglobus ruber]